MVAKIIAIVVGTLSLFYFGCASNTGLEEELFSAGSIISIDVDDKVKLEYLENIKNSLKLYRQVILDVRYYHPRSNFKELASEIDKYVETYIDDILIEYDSVGSIDISVEIAKIHLLVTSIYFDLGYNIRTLKYLELFHDHYHDDKYLLEKALDPRDIGYSSLGQGMRILEKKVFDEILPVIHGKMYPWEKTHGNK
jgi:hypothetical protein